MKEIVTTSGNSQPSKRNILIFLNNLNISRCALIIFTALLFRLSKPKLWGQAVAPS